MTFEKIAGNVVLTEPVGRAVIRVGKVTVEDVEVWKDRDGRLNVPFKIVEMTSKQQKPIY